MKVMRWPRRRRRPAEVEAWHTGYSRGYAQGHAEGSAEHSRCRDPRHLPSQAPLAELCTGCAASRLAHA